jgi:O-antigen/teichoic acid export membrane protein
MFFLIPTILFHLGDLGLPIAAAYYIAREPGHAPSIARLLLRPALLQGAALVALHAVLLVFYLGGHNAQIRAAGLLTLAAVPALLMQEYGLAIIQGQQRFRPFNVLRALPAALYAVIAVLVWTRKWGLQPATLLVMISWTISGIAILWVALRGLGSPDVARQTASRRQLLRFGLQSFVGSLYPVENFRIDQLIVGAFLSPAALGLYVVSLAFTNLPRFIAQSLGVVAYPQIASRRTQELRLKSTWRFFWFGVALSAIAVLVLEVTVGFLIPVLFGTSFRGSIDPARVLLVAGLFAGARRILTEALKGAGRPILGTISEFASWVAFALALALLVPTRGLLGVALAVAASSACSLAVLLILYRVNFGNDGFQAAEGQTEPLALA